MYEVCSISLILFTLISISTSAPLSLVDTIHILKYKIYIDYFASCQRCDVIHYTKAFTVVRHEYLMSLSYHYGRRLVKW